ncbi:MAG TPA: SOS response-associated peptidase family protein, partial [Phycisphaerales bacterium]|nr:SOS response-associated peptidase family protein [Phycisphaerales bacterium]
MACFAAVSWCVCGRYTHLFTWRQLHRLMGLVTPSGGQGAIEVEPLPLRYNVAPSQSAPAVIFDRDGGGGGVDTLGWGLVPSWAKD